MLIDHPVDAITPLGTGTDQTHVVEFQSGPGFRITNDAALHLAQQLLVALTANGTLPTPSTDDATAAFTIADAARELGWHGNDEIAARLREVLRTRFAAIPRHELDFAVAQRQMSGAL